MRIARKKIARKKIARRVKVRNCMRTIANKQKAVGHWKEKWIFLQRVMVFLASSLCARVVHHTNQFFGQIEVSAECRAEAEMWSGFKRSKMCQFVPQPWGTPP